MSLIGLRRHMTAVPCFWNVDKTCCKPAESLLGFPFCSQSRCSGALSSDHRVFIFSPSVTCEVFQTGFGHRPSLFIFLAVRFTLQVWAGRLQLGGHGIGWKPPAMWTDASECSVSLIHETYFTCPSAKTENGRQLDTCSVRHTQYRPGRNKRQVCCYLSKM